MTKWPFWLWSLAPEKVLTRRSPPLLHEQAQVGGAIISAREAPTGVFIKKSRGHNFVVARDEAGAWAFR